MTKNNLNVSCPICGDGEMEYKKLPNSLGSGLDKDGLPATHIWVCDTCPGILMEWYNKNDTVALGNYLHGEDGMH